VPATPRRGEVWLCRHGDKVRPVVVLSRDVVHARLAKVTVVPLSSNDRGWPDEVRFAVGEAGLRVGCVARCRELAHIPKGSLVGRVGDAAARLGEICRAVNDVLGC
jgi:mRNA-degrading endonuclease toxin of MazEF toxin-antitoxin module